MAGYVLVAAISIIAYYLGAFIPLVGGPVFGIILGMLVALWHRPVIFEAGILFISKKILPVSIILLGFEMNLFQVFDIGSQSLYIIVFTLSAAFITAWIFGHYFNLEGNTIILIGVGTAICGGSAIAATAPVISATDRDVAYSISTIFLFNIAAVFIFPFAGHLLGMSDVGFGMWAGTAINDTSSVVAAGYSYSNEAGNFATIVKLTRSLMIVPVTLVLALITAKKNTDNNAFSFIKIFPWFIFGFLAASIANTAEIIPAMLGTALAHTGKFFIIMAMTSIGLNTHLGHLVTHGIKPVLLGLSCWVAVALASVVSQYYLAIW